MGFAHSTGDEIFYYIKKEEKNENDLIRSVIWTRYRHIGTDKDCTNKYPKQVLELNDTELGFLNSSNDITSGDMDGILPGNDEVSGEI